MSTIIGIDLGTTFSLVAVLEKGQPRIISHEGERLLPSVVGWSPQGELLVGTPALNQYVLEPERTVKSIKRQMGCPDPVAVAGKTYTPAELSAFILRELKARAERYLGHPVQRAVITVPAYCNDAARQATWQAGELAGLEVARIINEPTAAALAYGLDRQADQQLVVYDLGGGTFDVSIVELSQGVIEVRASHGDLRLGGDDFDDLILRDLADGFQTQQGLDLRVDRRALARLRRASERAKIALSDAPYARVTEEFIARDPKGAPLHLDAEIARDRFEELIQPLVRSTMDSVDFALKDAGLRRRDLHKVLLVGGSTRIPLVRRLLAEHLGKEPHAEVHPDEAVALGAAVQGAIIAGEPIEAVLVDIAPRSLGIETARIVLDYPVYDRYSVLIPRNSTIPCSKARSFYTLSPQQDQAQIRVFQGDEAVASRNQFLGEFRFKGISPAPRGQSREVVVRFDYDVNGMVKVSAMDRRNHRAEGVTVTAMRHEARRVDEEEAPDEARPVARNRRLEREIDSLLRRGGRLAGRLRAGGQVPLADEVSAAMDDLDRSRKGRDYEQARVLMVALGELIYLHDG